VLNNQEIDERPGSNPSLADSNIITIEEKRQNRGVNLLRESIRSRQIGISNVKKVPQIMTTKVKSQPLELPDIYSKPTTAKKIANIYQQKLQPIV
jgi:hypothetical protein